MKYYRIYDVRDGDRFGLESGGIYSKSLIELVTTDLKKDGLDIPRYININGISSSDRVAHVQEKIVVHNLIGIKKYTDEYDRIMNLTLNIVRGANCTTEEYTDVIIDDYGRRKPFSIGIPHKMTWIKDDVFASDGGYRHPVHDCDWLDAICIQMRVERDVLLDYPRHGDKIRYHFDTIEEATAVLFMWKKYINNHLNNKEVA